jgi:hypothetical protein
MRAYMGSTGMDHIFRGRSMWVPVVWPKVHSNLQVLLTGRNASENLGKTSIESIVYNLITKEKKEFHSRQRYEYCSRRERAEDVQYFGFCQKNDPTYNANNSQRLLTLQPK